MKNLFFILSITACMMSCEKETAPQQTLAGQWTQSSQEGPYEILSFEEATFEIQRRNTSPMECQYFLQDDIILAKENSNPAYDRFADIESLNDNELKIRFLNTSVELRLDTTTVFTYYRNF